jgi:hypothetical protein
MTTANLAFVRFDKENKIRFGQDFRFFEGLPSDVNFYPIEETQSGYMVFIGNGYGIQSKHKIDGKYGNGAVFVIKEEITELLEWCRLNFLK